MNCLLPQTNWRGIRFNHPCRYNPPAARRVEPAEAKAQNDAAAAGEPDRSWIRRGDHRLFTVTFARP
jgi:hypothetical protein